MKRKLAIAVFVGLAVVVAGLIVNASGDREHDPKDLLYWLRAGDSGEWLTAAESGEPQAQFHYGAALIRTNLVAAIDRVPLLSSIPLIGRRFFERRSYSIDNRLQGERVMIGMRPRRLNG